MHILNPTHGRANYLGKEQRERVATEKEVNMLFKVFKL